MNSKVSDIQLMTALNKRRDKEFWNEDDEKMMQQKFENHISKKVFIASTTGSREMSTTETGLGLFFEEIDEDGSELKTTTNQEQNPSSTNENFLDKNTQSQLTEKIQFDEQLDSDSEPILIPEEEEDDAKDKKLVSYSLQNKMNLNTMVKFKKRDEFSKPIEKKEKEQEKPEKCSKSKIIALVDYSDASEEENSVE